MAMKIVIIYIYISDLLKMMLKQMFARPMNQMLMMRNFTAKVFIEGLPSEWTHHEIAQRFSIAGNVQKVNLVKNSMGHNTGKAIVTFE